MKYRIFENYRSACDYVARDIAKTVREKPEALLCLAAGHTSLGIFDAMAELQNSGEADFRTAYIVGLDEWSGMSRDEDGSCAGFLYTNIFDRIRIPYGHIRLFDGKYTDGDSECRLVEEFIASRSGIDYMLLGIGMNGHLGLNEPGTDFSLGAHVTGISETTLAVGQKYFRQPTRITGGITLGIRNILESRRIVLVTDSARKSRIISEFYRLDPDPKLPATALKAADHCEIVLDRDAAINIKELLE
ncbi:MAG: 6-phosphogluconolactonase [Saccharofermentanales bacterium]